MPVDVEKVKAFIKVPNAKTYIEVGVYTGKGITNVANAFPTLETILGVDSYKAYVDEFLNYGQGPDTTQTKAYTDSNYIVSEKQSKYNRLLAGNRISECVHKDKIQLLEQDSIEAAKLISDGTVDIVFLDAYTNIPRAHEDVKAWYPKVANGGILSGQSWHPTISIVPEIRIALDAIGCSTEIQTDGIFWYIQKEA